MERRTYHQNPEPAEVNQEPAPPSESKAWGVVKTLLLAGASAVTAVIAVDFYRKLKNGKKDEEEMVQNPGGGMGPNIYMGGQGPQIIPLPLPWPTSMPMMPQPAHVLDQVTPNKAPTAKEEIELQRLKTEEAKANALRAQLDAWIEDDD